MICPKCGNPLVEGGEWMMSTKDGEMNEVWESDGILYCAWCGYEEKLRECENNETEVGEE